MGRLADSVLTAGGEVTGVEPQFFIDSEVQYDGLTKLIVTKDMTERKTRMIELGDAFIAFPGGTGTLEEIAEVMSKVSLGHLDAPCILYDLDDYYAGLKALLAHMVETGLSSPCAAEGHLLRKELGRDKKSPASIKKKRWKPLDRFQRFVFAVYMEMTPRALATELTRMMAAKMGQRYFIIKLKMRLRRKDLPSSVTSSSIFSTPMTRDTSRQVVMAAMGIMTELVRKSKKSRNCIPKTVNRASRAT